MRCFNEKSFFGDFISYARVDVGHTTYSVLKIWRCVFYIYDRQFKRDTGKRLMFRFLS